MKPNAVVTLVVAVMLAAWLGLASRAAAQVRAEAFSGEPYGVGRVEVRLPQALLPETLGLSGVGLSEKDGRVLYPVVDSKVVRQAIRDLLARPQVVNVYFLFQGAAPLTLSIQSRTSQTITLPTSNSSIAHRALLQAWWKEYHARPSFFGRSDDCPPMVTNYLGAMLSQRLKLPLPDRRRDDSWQEQLDQAIGATMADESVMLAIQRDRFQGGCRWTEPADQPFPAAIDLAPLEVPAAPDNVAIDPLALRTPAECFYVRFGSFSNYLWLQDTFSEWGGDLRNLLALRGLDFQVRQRMESQLVLHQTELARLMGDTVVADVAIIGTDLSLIEGAAFGLVFHARKNNPFLAATILQERLARVRQGGVSEENLTLAGKPVSLLQSADGSVRSYYVADGEYHFVTTSRTLVERFLETGQGKTSLGATAEFRHARTLMPLERNDTVFVYCSDVFFRNLVSPAYRIESTRRAQALADLELGQLAVLAAATERKPGGSIERLVAGGFLPAGFGSRPDGSRTLLDHGDVVDSLRGHRGGFVPLPDVPVNKVSRGEADEYRQFAESYRQRWGRLSPIQVGIRRQSQPDRRERITIDLRMTPLNRRIRDLLTSDAGPADRKRLPVVPGDVVTAQLILPDQRVFGGLQKIGSLTTTEGLAWTLGLFQNLLVGYVGTLGNPGVLNFLDARVKSPPDAQGYAAGTAGLWRYQEGPLSVFSMQKGVLDVVVPRLQLADAERPAQLRLDVADLSAGSLASPIRRWSYSRTRQTSLGNLRLLNELQQQLHIPGPNAKEAAELLLGSRLKCPLGGQYVYQVGPGGSFWTSTALAATPRVGLIAGEVPTSFQAPPLNWFRGLVLDALLEGDTLSVHADLDMQKPPPPPVPPLDDRPSSG